MMHEDECEERQSDHRVWRGEINFPDPSMANHFNEWWQNEGWRSFRDWHPTKSLPGAGSVTKKPLVENCLSRIRSATRNPGLLHACILKPLTPGKLPVSLRPFSYLRMAAHPSRPAAILTSVP